MNRHIPYDYSYPATTSAATSSTMTAEMPVAPSYPTHHGTSSAFSDNANPNEDWTKISDLAERRRIQNRIAQRNYRKKLKRRLEDLERRASKSASPEQSHEEIAQSKPQTQKSQSPRSESNNNTASRKGRSSTSSNASWNPSQRSPNFEQHQVYSPMPDERVGGGPGGYFYTPQPSYHEAYNHPNAYPAAQPPLQQPHHLDPYQTPPQHHYMDLAAPLPSQHPLEHLSQDQNPMYPSALPPKHLNAVSEEAALNPLCISYASVTGLDMPASQYTQYNTQHESPPLTNPSFSDGYSSSTSPARSLSEPYPLTPEPPCLTLDHLEFI